MNASESSSFSDEKAAPPTPADRDALKAKTEARQKAAADAAAAKKLARATSAKEVDTPQKARAPAKRHPAATPLIQTESTLPPDADVQMAQAEAQLQQHLTHVFVQGQVDGFRIGVFFGAGALLALGAAYYGYKYMYPAAEAISAAQ